MHRKYFAAAVLLVAAALAASPLVVAIPAFAQDANTRVNLDPLIAEIVPYVLTILSAVATAAIAWASKKFNEWTGIQIEAKHREALQSALLNGARAAISKNVPTGVGIDVKSASLREGVEFVLSSVPDAVRYFGLTPADIEKHLIPKLSAIAGDTR